MRMFKRVAGWFEDRTGLGSAIKPILDHPVPYTNFINGVWYVFGSAVLIAFLIQVISGIALATSYVPSVSQAYDSLRFITDAALFGNFLRGMHAWGASAMVLLIGLHALHSFIIGSYKYPREMNWLSGALLLVTTLAMAFTGQLLRWDQTAFWTIIVGSNMAARAPFVGQALAEFIMSGNTVGGATLSRFYSFHVFFIPALIFVFLGLHLFLVVRNGISEPPKMGHPVDPKTYRRKYHDLLEKEGVPFYPDAVYRDVVGAILLLVVIVVLSLAVGPPELGQAPDPTNLRAYPRPDWYFLWFFSVLALVPSQAESAVIILGPLLVGVLIVALPFISNKGERHPLRRPWAMIFTLFVIVLIGTLWIVGEQAPWVPKLDAEPLPASVVNSTNPTVIAGAKLFNEKGCEYCHRVGDYGGGKGPNLSNVGVRRNESQLITRILNGGVGMPAYGSTLKSDELKSLVAFLQTRKSSEP